MKKENEKGPKSMFGHGTEDENEEMSHQKAEPDHEEELGAEHPEEDATGAPVHPKLQTLMGALNEKDEEPLAKGGFLGLRKKKAS